MPCINKDRGCFGNMCDGSGLDQGDTKCYRYIETAASTVCKRMNAICPQANCCYSETVETSETDCNQGYVLCVDIDNPDNRYMYSIEVLKDMDENKEDYEGCPF